MIATHPEQALRMLSDASPAEKEALGGMPYSVNHTVFHRDGAVLPSSDNAKASWNYRLPSCDARPDKVLVSYDMTRLQRLEPADGRPYIVSLGESELIADGTVLDRMVYEHPQYTPGIPAGPAADPGTRRRPAGLRRRVPGLGLPRGRRALRRPGGGPAGTRAGTSDCSRAQRAVPGRLDRPGSARRLRGGRMSTTAAIYRTSIAHVRRTPLRNAFTYRSYSWYVDVDRLPTVPRLLRPLAGFRVADHLGDPDGTLRGNVERFLATRGIEPRRRPDHHAGQRPGPGARVQPAEPVLVP